MNPHEAVPDTAIEMPQRQTARLLGVSAASLVAWERDAGLPSLGDRGRERYYDATAVVQWYLGRELARRGADDPDRRRLVKAQADRAELELARRLGEVCDTAGVVRAGRELGNTIGRSFLDLAPQIAGTLVGLTTEQLQAALEAEIGKRIEAAADACDRLGDEYERRRAGAAGVSQVKAQGAA